MIATSSKKLVVDRGGFSYSNPVNALGMANLHFRHTEKRRLPNVMANPFGLKADGNPLPALTNNRIRGAIMADGIPTPVRGVVQTSKGEIPDWLPPTPDGQCQGYHCGERMVAALYMPDGTLFQVQCTERGKAIWPLEEAAPHVGKFSVGYVYFVQAENGLIKIGFATNVQRRVASLRTMSPLRLTILATLSKDGMKTETAYHARFSRHRQHGEWFSPAPEILAEITRIKSEYPQ